MADLAAPRRLELDGEVEVAWPWNPLRPGEAHAPLDERVELLAHLLGCRDLFAGAETRARSPAAVSAVEQR